MHDGAAMVRDLRREGYTLAAISDMTGLTKGQVSNRARKRPTGQSTLRTAMPSRVIDVVIRRSWEIGYSPHEIVSDRRDLELAHARLVVLRAFGF